MRVIPNIIRKLAIGTRRPAMLDHASPFPVQIAALERFSGIPDSGGVLVKVT
jgi:hypothetical protein